MVSKQINEFNKVYRGTLKDVQFSSRRGSDELTQLVIVIAVPTEVTVRGEKKVINVNYSSRVKSITSQAQEVFTIDPLLAQVYEFDEENELKTTLDKVKKLREHIDLDEVAFEMIHNSYASYDADGNQITVDGYDMVFDEANFQ